MKNQLRGEMMLKISAIIFSLFLLVSANFSLVIDQPGIIPVTGKGQTIPASAGELAILDSAALSHIVLENGLELPIARQPRGNTSFVSSVPDEITLFSMTQKFGSFGLLAHNYLAGEYFYDLGENAELQLILADGSFIPYEIMEVHEFQAVQPNSIKSDFIDLRSGETISTRELFMRMYGTAGYLTLQTCLERDGNMEWGRRFVVARPVESV
jgi:hypothetical protein